MFLVAVGSCTDFLFALYFDQKKPTTKPIPITKVINAAFDQINGESLVKTPNNNPKNAGAIAELGPSEIVGVAMIANTIIHVIPPTGEGNRFAIEYQHLKIISVPRI